MKVFNTNFATLHNISATNIDEERVPRLRAKNMKQTHPIMLYLDGVITGINFKSLEKEHREFSTYNYQEITDNDTGIKFYWSAENTPFHLACYLIDKEIRSMQKHLTGSSFCEGDSQQFVDWAVSLGTGINIEYIADDVFRINDKRISLYDKYDYIKAIADLKSEIAIYYIKNDQQTWSRTDER